MYEDFYVRLEALGVMPVVVLERAQDAVPLAHALVAGGLPAAEVTFRTACAAECIAAMREAEPGMLVGAGTVLNEAQVDEAIRVGAQFVVSPGWSVRIVARVLEQDVPALPGTVTPTDLMAARAMGLEVTKFFPAAQFGGLSTIRALSAAFIGHRFMPTGGVSAGNLAEFLADPAIIACGGTWMVKPALFADGDFSQVTALSEQAVRIVEYVRS
jgi:2-dehydro-3-deoxyphosphogluconate aldolase/(4S)-4-hydroxy-2-oxoglutarate aldolase